MEKQPLVSVIIACYNAEKYINLCLEALINQTYRNLEILICDDCSTDNSYKILLGWLNKDERIVLLRNETNLHAAATRNKCIEKSHGAYLMIQDVDDVSSYDRTEKLVEAIQETGIDFVSTSMLPFKETPQKTGRVMSYGIPYPQKKHFLWNLPFFHPTTIFTRECIEAVNGYRVAKETRRGQDYDMFMRLYAKGYKGKNLEEPLYFFRLDDDNIRRRNFEARIGEYHIRKERFKELGMMPWALPFVFKPFLAHLIQKMRYFKLLFKK